MQYDENGDEFFIILHGTVEVLIPDFDAKTRLKPRASESSHHLVDVVQNAYLLTKKKRMSIFTRQKTTFFDSKSAGQTPFKSVTTLTTGKAFGEKALIDKSGKRTATVK